MRGHAQTPNALQRAGIKHAHCVTVLSNCACGGDEVGGLGAAGAGGGILKHSDALTQQDAEIISGTLSIHRAPCRSIGGGEERDRYTFWSW